MRISNMGLMVKDLEGARKFFEDYFGAVLHAEYCLTPPLTRASANNLA